MSFYYSFYVQQQNHEVKHINLYSVAVIVMVFPFGSSNLSMVFISIIMPRPKIIIMEKIVHTNSPDHMGTVKK